MNRIGTSRPPAFGVGHLNRREPCHQATRERPTPGAQSADAKWFDAPTAALQQARQSPLRSNPNNRSFI